MKVHRILWPTDFSDRANQALDKVQSLAGKYDAEVHVLYVIDNPVLHHPEWYGDIESDHVDKMLAWQNRKAQKRLEQICREQLQGCPGYVQHIATGDPAQEILKLVDREDIAMIVLATRGAKAHFRFGSVAEKVVKNAPVPVVVIPPQRTSGAAA